MPVYILREGETNCFKIGRTSGDVDARIASLRTGNSRPLTVFDKVITSNESACEVFFHRCLQSKKLKQNGGREFYEVEPELMRRLVVDFKAMFEELEEARAFVTALKEEQSSDSVLEPTSEDRLLLQEWARNREEQAFLKFECEIIESRIMRRMGSAASMRGFATFKTEMRREFNEKLFMQAMPEMYESLLEKYHRIDTKAWKEAHPKEYQFVQTTYYSPCYRRSLKPI